MFITRACRKQAAGKPTPPTAVWLLATALDMTLVDFMAPIIIKTSEQANELLAAGAPVDRFMEETIGIKPPSTLAGHALFRWFGLKMATNDTVWVTTRMLQTVADVHHVHMTIPGPVVYGSRDGALHTMVISRITTDTIVIESVRGSDCAVAAAVRPDKLWVRDVRTGGDASIHPLMYRDFDLMDICLGPGYNFYVSSFFKM